MGCVVAFSPSRSRGQLPTQFVDAADPIPIFIYRNRIVGPRAPILPSATILNGSLDAQRWALVINDLAIGLQQIQRLTSDLTRLDAVIDILENLITVDSPDLPEHPALLDNLGFALHSRFESSCSRNDLEGAILLHTKALGVHAQDSLNYAISFGNLGRALHSRFHHFRSNPKDIERAVVHHRQALQLLQPSDDPLRPPSLYALGNSLIHAHSLARECSDCLEEAMSLFCAATQFFAQPYVLRFYVARKSSLIKVFQTVARHMQHPDFDFRGSSIRALTYGLTSRRGEFSSRFWIPC